MESLKVDILTYFKDLQFDEKQHTYTVNGKKLKISVSGLYKKYVQPFDKYAKSLEISERTGEPQADILKAWDDKGKKAIKIGKEAHLFGELYPFNKQLKPKNKYEEAIVHFWNDLPEIIVPVITEVQMYHKEYMFAGTADILLYNTVTEKYIIGDYKTNADLFKNYKGRENNYKGKKMLGPFSSLLDQPFNHYQLQLSFYQILLEQLGLEVASRKIIHIKPNGMYDLYGTEDYTGILKEELKTMNL